MIFIVLVNIFID